MIIDMHTHVYPDKIAARVVDSLGKAAHLTPAYAGTAEALAADAGKAGIDLSVVLPVATSPSQVEKINTRAAELNAAWGNRGLFSIGGMHPEYDDFREELKRIKALGLKGIKIHPVYQNVEINDVRYMRIFEVCEGLGLYVVTHAGDDIGFPGVVKCDPKRCAKVLREFKDLTMVLAHMGGWKNWEEVLEYLPGSGAYIDTSFSTGAFAAAKDGFWSAEDTKLLDQEHFEELVRAFGSEKVLFGTDNPWASKEVQIDFIRNSSLTSSEKRMIFEENARKLLGL